MRCKNFRCIYNNEACCTAGEILIDSSGKCADFVCQSPHLEKTGKILANGVGQKRIPQHSLTLQQKADLETFLRRIKKPKK